MTILDKISNKFMIDVQQNGSTCKEIDDLISFSSISIPNEFLELIKEMTEIEINVENEKYIRIWGADGCIEMNEANLIQKYIPNSLAIGDDEGGNALLYTIKNGLFGVYIVAFNDLGIDELVFIAPSLEDFFVNNIGIREFINFI